jgi:glycosyltransferase involved in cell wall biosynthesis
MKILILANRLPHGNVAGGHRLIYQRMRQLIERGHEVGLAAFIDPEEEQHLPGLRRMLLEAETIPAKRRQLVVRMFRDYVSGSLPAIYWKNHAPAMMKLVGDMVERSKYDVVVAEFSEMGMYLYRNPYLSAVHKVVSCHRCLTTAFTNYMETPGIPLSLRLKSTSQMHVLEKYEFELYSTMDHILTLTDEDRFTLLRHAPQLPVSVIRPGIDFDYLDRKPTTRSETPIIMMCGYFADKSNNDGALWFAHEVWPKLAKQHPELQCIFVGEGTGNEMKRLAEQEDRILVCGHVDDLRPYREQATIFINPVRMGSGLRVKVLEAMATGLPVVSTALGVAGIPAQNGVNCFVADTPELFAQSIEWLLNDARLAGGMGMAAKEMVKKQYDIRSTIRELEQVLAEVVSI